MHTYDVDFIQIGKRLRESRLDRHYTQEQLAEMADLSSSFVGHIERAEKIPAINTVAKLSKCLNISLDYLIFGTIVSCDKEQCALYTDLIRLIGTHSGNAIQHTTINERYEYEFE